MLIKLTVKEMAALALALQERPVETREDSKKIVPPPAGGCKRVELRSGQLVHLRGSGFGIRIEQHVDFDCECFVIVADGDSALIETVNGPVLAVIDDIEAAEDAKA